MSGIFQIDFSMTKDDLATLLPVSLATITFIIYWFTAMSPKIKGRFLKNNDPDTSSVKSFLFNKAFGFFIMGVVPLVTCLIVFKGSTLASYGLVINPDSFLLTVVCIAILSTIVIAIAILSARKKEYLVNYPQIRAGIWTKRTILATIAGWAIYLLGYETLFRGILLMPLAHHLGIWPAIIVNLSFYSATHIPKGLAEAVGAIPLGLVFCVLALITGTIWVAFFVHFAMAITNCLAAFKFHPDMTYRKS